MKAEVIAIGSELLMPGRVETNASEIGTRLREVGIDVQARITVADDPGVLESAFRSALGRADLVIATGGLGPTEDDLTREAAAAALGLPIRRDDTILQALRDRFASFGRVMAPVNEQQADLIEGARVLPNTKGTAPGQLIERDGRVVVLLPGPPFEMRPMLEDQVLPLLKERAAGRVLRTLILKLAGSESDIEQVIAPLYKKYTNPRTTILGSAGLVELQLTAEAEDEASASALCEELAAAIRAALPGRIFCEDGSELQDVVARLLLERGVTLALAESCTGGMLAARLTDGAGASGFLQQGWVTYSNASKVAQLGVPTELLERHGSVSAEVASAMAQGARARSGADASVAITGIAGPGGATGEKPVGLVFIALDGALGTTTRRCHFPGDRSRIRQLSVHAALEMMRRGLLGLPPA